jgi:photosystem II stability/assembly factor-like uncharacterized protein
MRFLLLLLTVATAAAQSGPRVQLSHTTEGLRGVIAISRKIAWASGTHGTYLRTVDGGVTWTPAQIADAAALDFRAVAAFSADEAFLMSAGPGDQSRIYHTADGGQHWQLQFTNDNPKGFFDSMVFWDSKHCIVLGDPIPDASGKLKFELLITDDGQTWHPIPPSQLPEAQPGEGAFAASNSCIAILHSQSTQNASVQDVPVNPVILSGAVAQAQREQLRSRRIPTPSTSFGPHYAPFPEGEEDWAENAPSTTVEERRFSAASAAEEKGASAPNPNIWFATGGKTARVFRSPDRGQTWQVFDTPILHGPDSAGIFSIAFRDAQHGVIAGGDYKHPRDDGPNLAFTTDGGKTWTLSDIHPQAYFSAVAYDQQVNVAAIRQEAEQKSAEASGKKIRVKPVALQRLFIVGEDFVFDFRPPANPGRVAGNKKQGFTFNAVSPYPEGGALVVGPKGTIAAIP